MNPLSGGYSPTLLKKGKSLMGIFPDYTVLDLETTGLSPAKSDIIEFGIVKVSNFRITGTFQSFVNPGYSVSSFTTQLTGINDKMLRDAPSIDQALPKALAFIGDSLVIVHNASFDLGFMRQKCMSCLDKPFPNNSLDTVRMSRVLYPREKHHRLNDLMERFGIVQTIAHRALDDAENTQKCYAHMCDYAMSNHIQFEHTPSASSGVTPHPQFHGYNFHLPDRTLTKERSLLIRDIIRYGGDARQDKAPDYVVMNNESYAQLYFIHKGRNTTTTEALTLPNRTVKIISESMLLDLFKLAQEKKTFIS